MRAKCEALLTQARTLLDQVTAQVDACLAEQIDHDNLAAVQWQIGKGLARGKLTLRVDANGAWSFDHAVEVLNALAPLGIVVDELPMTPNKIWTLIQNARKAKKG